MNKGRGSELSPHTKSPTVLLGTMTSTGTFHVCCVFSALSLSVDRWSGAKTETRQRTRLTLEKAKPGFTPTSRQSLEPDHSHSSLENVQGRHSSGEQFVHCCKARWDLSGNWYTPPVSKLRTFLWLVHFRNWWLHLFLLENLLACLFLTRRGPG